MQEWDRYFSNNVLLLFVPCLCGYGPSIPLFLSSVPLLLLHSLRRPFYDEQFHGKDKHDLKPLILKGVRPYVDKRYLDPSSGVGYIEFHLAKIMMDCWKHDQNRRPTIATVLDSLRKTMIEAKKRGDLEPSDRIRTPVIVS